MKIKKFTENFNLLRFKHLLMIVSVLFAVASVVSVGLSVWADAYDNSSGGNTVTEDNTDSTDDSDSAELLVAENSSDEYDDGSRCTTTQNNMGYVKSMTMKTVKVTVRKGKKKTIDGPVIKTVKGTAKTAWYTGRGDEKGYRILKNYDDSVIGIKAVNKKGKTSSILYSEGGESVIFTKNERIQIEGIEKGTTYFYVASVGWAESKKGTGIVVDKDGYIKNAVIKVKVTVIDPYVEAVVPNTKVTLCKGASKTNRIGISTQDMKSKSVTVESNDESVAVADYYTSKKSASKQYLTITGKKTGTAKITVKVAGTGKDGKKYSNTQTINVTVVDKDKQDSCDHEYMAQYKLKYHKAEKVVTDDKTRVYDCPACSTCDWSGSYLGRCGNTELSIHQDVTGHSGNYTGFAEGPVKGTCYAKRESYERVKTSKVCIKCGMVTNKKVPGMFQNVQEGY
jgi:hypothetical protein